LSDEDAKSARRKCEHAKFDSAAVIAACCEAIRLNPKNRLHIAARRRAGLRRSCATTTRQSPTTTRPPVCIKIMVGLHGTLHAWSKKGNQSRSVEDAEEAKNQNLDCERRQGGFDGRLFDECSVSVRSTDAVCVLPVSRTVLARRPERCNAIRRIRRYFGRNVTKVFALPRETDNLEVRRYRQPGNH
jgi:hypothetical protein